MILFNYITNNFYDFNLDKWFDSFSDHSAFYDNWYKVLLSSFQDSVPSIETGFYFQHPFDLGNQFLFLHFDINHITNCSYLKEDIAKIDLTKIGTPETYSPILFTPTIDNELIHLLTHKPITLCSIPTDLGIRHVVIDGNHRVTMKKSHHFKKINALYYIPDSENDFATKFEYDMYTFMLELYKKLSFNNFTYSNM